MTNPVTEFLLSRKTNKIKQKLKEEFKGMNAAQGLLSKESLDSERKRLEEEIDARVGDDFSVDRWVENASERILNWANPDTKLSVVSHPGKFSHPDARITPILFDGARAPDGYLRSGNADARHDVIGDAKLLDIHAFLSIKLHDGCDLLEHFECDSTELKKLLNVDAATFKRWRESFLLIKKASAVTKTHPNVKQVYFPVKDDYHLLSVLYPSGLMTEHRERILQMKFSDATKEAREARKKGECHSTGFFDMPGILTQSFGGTKPQNISKLNSNNGGKAWLLPCLPPELKHHYLPLPKSNFFHSLRWDQYLRDILTALHKLFLISHNNKEIRNLRKRLILQLLDWVMTRAIRLQQQPPGWSDATGFRLPRIQQLWLDSAYNDERDTHENWQQKISRAIGEWIVMTYKRSRKHQKDAVQLGEIEVKEFQRRIEEFIL